jgi:hypothetical protein
MLVVLGACLPAKRKSAQYYYENKTAIEEVRLLFDSLYKHQPFSAGFSDRSFQYYLLEVTTDSVRYIYDTEKNKPLATAAITRFGYDTTLSFTLARLLKKIKCLWISKRSFYVNQQRETVTFLSFKSVANTNLFSENKYYTLVFLPHPISSKSLREKVRKGDIVQIEGLVYFLISSNFR